MSRGYEAAIEAAGATVHIAQSFGDYQGTVWAKVTYLGKTGWISYAYGSCSGCDSYEGWESDLNIPWGEEIPNEKLADFGRDYVSEILTQEQALSAASKHSEWDTEADHVIAFLTANEVSDAE